MQAELDKLISNATDAIANVSDAKALDDIRVQYLGKKGEITARMKQLGSLSAEERPKAGQVINQAKQQIQKVLEAKKEELDSALLNEQLSKEQLAMNHEIQILTSPAEMGELFKVIALGKDFDDQLAGFVLRDMRGKL